MFLAAMTDAALRVQARLDAALAPMADVPVVAAMRYGVQGGKRLRGFLVLESARLNGVSPDAAIHGAAAVEALHAYSLIHDDLPCMDDDALRRGVPTVHVKWGETTAVLAGDALQALAFELLCDPGLGPADLRLVLIAALARASGAGGMVLGQARDIAAETAAVPLGLAEITGMQAAKTGALIRWSAEAGAVLGGADLTPMTLYATALGLAFQIADDILDVTGDVARTGKRLGKDAAAGKATFVSLLGLAGARRRAEDLVAEACDALAPYGEEAECLREAARFVISRDN